MNIEVSNFVDNLYYMGIGMLGIFIVIGLIIAVTMILNAVTSPKKKNND
ncbi:MAG: oxaloacetate decarboxylase [Oscillospiraceae bacterium]|nr:oxaloacetate decarboxylase [Oscillospiraceae bacterium]